MINPINLLCLCVCVGAAPRPWLSIVRTKDKEVVLKCEAEGLVYKPELVLLNSKGTILPADEPTERPMDSEGLYTVTRYFTVQKTATNVFTCQVQQLEIKHMRETQIHVPGELVFDTGLNLLCCEEF